MSFLLFVSFYVLNLFIIILIIILLWKLLQYFIRSLVESYESLDEENCQSYQSHAMLFAFQTMGLV